MWQHARDHTDSQLVGSQGLDVHGASVASDAALATFDLIVNTPPTADAGGPYMVLEGGSVGLDASASTDPDEAASGLVYEWDFDDDGVFDDAKGITPTFSASELVGQTR